MLRPRLAALLLVLLVAAVGMLDTGVAAVEEGSMRGHHHYPPLLDCGPPSKNDDDAVFRANLSSALAEARSAAATVPEAFVTIQIGRAFAHAVCFRSDVSSPAVTSACNACLSAAARDVTRDCAASARAGAWRDVCFVSYADSDATSPQEDAFRGWFYTDPTTPAAALDGGYCVLDSAVCDRCFHDSARAAPALSWLQRIHGEEVLVVGYNCLLRVKKSSLPQGPDNGDAKSVALAIWMGMTVEIEAIILAMVFYRIVKIVRALPQVNG